MNYLIYLLLKLKSHAHTRAHAKGGKHIPKASTARNQTRYRGCLVIHEDGQWYIADHTGLAMVEVESYAHGLNRIDELNEQRKQRKLDRNVAYPYHRPIITLTI